MEVYVASSYMIEFYSAFHQTVMQTFDGKYI